MHSKIKEITIYLEKKKYALIMKINFVLSLNYYAVLNKFVHFA